MTDTLESSAQTIVDAHNCIQPIIRGELETTMIATFGRDDNHDQSGWYNQDLMAAKRRLDEFWRNRFQQVMAIVGTNQMYLLRYNFSNQQIATDSFVHQSTIDSGRVVHIGGTGDWFVVPNGTSAMALTGDCPTVVITDRSSTIVVHCGRDNLWNAGLVNKNLPAREHESILEQVLDSFPHKSQLLVRITSGISAKSFSHPSDHPLHGSSNQQMVGHICQLWGERACWQRIRELGCLDLEFIITRQLVFFTRQRSQEIVSLQSDLGRLDTFSHAQFWSHRKATQEKSFSGRNAVVVATH